jgi:hypothetical protein
LRIFVKVKRRQSHLHFHHFFIPEEYPMTLLSPLPTKAYHWLTGLAAITSLLGCVGARNSAPLSPGHAENQLQAAQVLPDAAFGAEAMAFSNPSIAQDAHGNRIAVWEAFDGQRFNIWAKRSVAGLGWGASTQISAHQAGNAFRPRIAMDAQGHAMAVWELQRDGHYKVWANRYVAGQGWGVALPVDRMQSITPSDAFAPQVALNAVGEAVAVWQQSDGYHTHIRTNRYIPGVGWSSATSIGSATAHASAPQIAFNAQGVALAVWQQSDGQRSQVWASQQSAGGNWGAPSLVPQPPVTPDGDALASELLAQSNAVAAWQSTPGASHP